MEWTADNEDEVVDQPDDVNATPETGEDIVVKIISGISKRPDQEEEYRKKVESLGITCLSDFKYIDYNVFNDILKPVEIGKLKHTIVNFGVDKNNERNAEQMFIEITDVFSSHFITSVLMSKKRISKPFRTKISEAVGQELWLKYQKRNVPLKVCVNVSNYLTKKYPSAFQSHFSKCGSNLGAAIYNHIRYLSKVERKGQASLDPNLTASSFSKRENIGLEMDRDSPPNLPEGETVISQQAKKKILIEMNDSGNVNSKEVLRLMKATYASQRLLIQTKVTADKLLEEWPFFGKFGVLQYHFSYLMMIEEHETRYLDKMNDFCPKFIEFVNCEANQKLGARASETAKNIVKDLSNILKRLKKNRLTPSSEFAAVILSAACLLSQQDLSKLFIYFNDTTNVHEVQASPHLPRSGIPVVAVLGEDIIEEPKTIVLVDNVVLSRPQCPLKSIMSVFMLYWVLKLKIPKQIGGIMEFIQRAIFELDVPSRVERVKTGRTWATNPPKRSKKYDSLMDKFEDFRSRWD